MHATTGWQTYSADRMHKKSCKRHGLAASKHLAHCPAVLGELSYEASFLGEKHVL